MNQDQELPQHDLNQHTQQQQQNDNHQQQQKQQVLKDTIKSLNNHFNHLNKEIDTLKEIKEKESVLLNREIAELKLEMDKLRKNNNRQMKSIEVLGQSIHCLQDEDVIQSPWSDFIY